MRFKAIIALVLMLLFMSSVVYAQPGGGERPGGRPGGNVPDNAPDVERPTPPPINISPENRGGSVPDDLPDVESLNPEDLMAQWQTVTLPDDMPQSVDDLQAMLETLDIPYDFDFAVEDWLPTSDTAYNVIVNFGQMYLGTTVAPIYAGTSADISASGGMMLPNRQGQRPNQANMQDIPDMSAYVAQIESQFPDEVASLLANANGIAYWGIMSNGGAVVYSGDCTGAQCTIEQDQIQATIVSGSLGAYGFYTNQAVNTANEALTLVLAMFPGLSQVGLDSASAETGYAFTASGMTMDTITAYYAGVMSVEGQTLVYAVVGTGAYSVDLSLGLGNGAQ